MGIFNKKSFSNNEEPKTTEFSNIKNQKDIHSVDGNPDKTQTFSFAEFDTKHRTHFEPLTYEDTKEIADTLIRFKEVTVSFLSIVDRSEKRRVIDFLTGVMYGFDGIFKKVEYNIYVFKIK